MHCLRKTDRLHFDISHSNIITYSPVDRNSFPPVNCYKFKKSLRIFDVYMPVIAESLANTANVCCNDMKIHVNPSGRKTSPDRSRNAFTGPGIKNIFNYVSTTRMLSMGTCSMADRITRLSTVGRDSPCCHL